MSKKEQIRLIIGIVINLTIFGLEVFCLCNFINYLIQGNPDNRFRYFTNISNLAVGTVALINIVLLSLSIYKKRIIYPKLLSVIKFMAIVMTTLTFLTVLLVLAPITSYQEMYSNVKFITHLVTPLLALLSYLFFEEKELFNWKLSLLGIAPFAIYTIIYIINVVFLDSWPDLYKVNAQGLWYLYVIGFFVAVFGVSQGLYFLKKLIISKK